MASEYVIEMKGLTKTFGSVVANKDVDLTLRQGEILALLGENGSGKTTLMNMLSGIYQPDRGQILMDGIPVTINSPADSEKRANRIYKMLFFMVVVRFLGVPF